MTKHLLFLMVLISFSCSTPQKTIDKSSIEQIEFGGGGGVTGQETVFTLTDESQLYENKEFIKKIDFKKTADIFKKAIKFKDFDYQKPGNIYSFIRIQTGSKSNSITWTIGNEPESEEFLKLYQKLQELSKP